MASTSITRSISSTSAIKKFTLSMWVKRSGLGSYQRIFCSDGGTGDTYFRFQNNDAIEWSGHTSDATAGGLLTTSRLFRDTNAWYHFVIKVDTTQSTASDRLKFWVNGVLETAFSAETMPNQDVTDNIVNTSKTHRISGTSSAQYLDGSIAHFHFTQGYAYDASTFGEFDSTSGIWVPKTAPSVTYGTNGFFLKFENSGNLDLDSSGNGLTFATSGTLTQNVDSPDNNYATMNPLDNYYANQTFTQGNNTVKSDHPAPAVSTFGMSSGKWYFEGKAITSTSGNDWHIGIVSTQVAATSHEIGHHPNDYAYYGADGNSRTGNSGSSYGNTYTAGDIIGCAVDLTNNKLYFSKNGTWQNSGVPTSGGTGTGAISITAPASTSLGAYFVAVGANASANDYTWSMNFGNGYFGTTAVASANADDNGHGAFEYDVPAGYYALNTKNIKEFG
tara:strand:+ start:160 stop:1497 length:1338 start_codon:yes stop_codon:yes gene_type:complete